MPSKAPIATTVRGAPEDVGPAAPAMRIASPGAAPSVQGGRRIINKRQRRSPARAAIDRAQEAQPVAASAVGSRLLGGGGAVERLAMQEYAATPLVQDDRG